MKKDEGVRDLRASMAQNSLEYQLRIFVRQLRLVLWLWIMSCCFIARAQSGHGTQCEQQLVHSWGLQDLQVVKLRRCVAMPGSSGCLPQRQVKVLCNWALFRDTLRGICHCIRLPVVFEWHARVSS